MGFIYTKSFPNMPKYFMRIEKKLNEYKRTGRIRQEIDTFIAQRILRPKPKKFRILNHLSRHDRMGKKTISHYCPFKFARVPYMETLPSLANYPPASVPPEPTLYQKSDLCIPRIETALPRSQFLYSWICECFIYSQDRSAFLAAK